MTDELQAQRPDTPEEPRSTVSEGAAAIVAPRSPHRDRKIGSDEMKAEIAAYWRYVRQYPIIAVEYDGMDVAAARRDPRAFVETEVKTSIDDLRADGVKDKHFYYSGDPKDLDRCPFQDMRAHYLRKFKPNFFFFAVPNYLLDKALPVVQNLYPYAGLISVRAAPHARGVGCKVSMRAKNLRTSEVTDAKLWDLVEGQSAALTRNLDHLVGVSQRLVEAERLVRSAP